MNCVVTVDIRAVGYRVPLYQILTRGRQKEAMTAVCAQVGRWAGGRAGGRHRWWTSVRIGVVGVQHYSSSAKRRGADV